MVRGKVGSCPKCREELLYDTVNGKEIKTFLSMTKINYETELLCNYMSNEHQNCEVS